MTDRVALGVVGRNPRWVPYDGTACAVPVRQRATWRGALELYVTVDGRRGPVRLAAAQVAREDGQRRWRYWMYLYGVEGYARSRAEAVAQIMSYRRRERRQRAQVR